MSAPLPHPHSFITAVISQLGRIDSTPVTALSSLCRHDLKSAKSIFIALHFLFPHELLPALDLLDRKLVIQLISMASRGIPESTPGSCPSQPDRSSATTEQAQWEIFYVQSASAALSSSKSNSRYRRVYNPTAPYYEVRLDAWNCTCPAFAFSAFGGASDISHDQVGPANEEYQAGVGIEADGEGWRFGGIATGDGTAAPICKHILAAVLGKALPGLFGHGVERKEVTATEAAGWGAGWGD